MSKNYPCRDKNLQGRVNSIGSKRENVFKEPVFVWQWLVRRLKRLAGESMKCFKNNFKDFGLFLVVLKVTEVF